MTPLYAEYHESTRNSLSGAWSSPVGLYLVSGLAQHESRRVDLRRNVLYDYRQNAFNV